MRPVVSAICSAAVALSLLAGCAGKSDPATALAQARGLIEQGRAGEARIHLKKLLTDHADASEPRILLARIALDAGDARAADAELAGLQPAQLRSAEAQATRAWVDLGLGKPAQVLQALDAKDVQIGASERTRLRAAALRATGAPADALSSLREAVAADSGDALLIVELATTLTAVGHSQQAEHELDAFLQTHAKNADAQTARGELRLRHGAPDKAIEDLRAALQNAPPSWPLVKRVTAELLLGDAALAAGKIDQAKQQLKALEVQYPTMPGTQLLAARVALLEGRVGEAVDGLQHISEAMPDNELVQYLLVDALLRSGNTARAANLLERRVKQSPSDTLARQLLARLLMRQNRPDRVVELLDDVNGDSSGEGDSEGLLSAARLAQEQAGEAIGSLQERLDQKPRDPTLRANLAAAYLLNGQPTRALTVLNEVRTVPPQPAAVAVEMAIHLALGHDREANVLVNQLLEAQDTPIETLLASADAAQRAGHRDIVGRLVDRALQNEADNTAALIRRANLDFMERRYDAAAKTLAAILQKHPNDSQARIALARVADAKGDVAAARAALRVATTAAPHAVEPALILAGLELRAGQPAAAAGVIDRMIAAAPADGVAANSAGQLLLSVRRGDEARTRFRQAVEQSANTARYWFNLGRAQVAVGDRQVAAQSFARAVELRPEWLDANVAAIRLSLEAGDRRTARELTQGLSTRMPTESNVWLLVGEVASMDGSPADAAQAFARSFALQPSAIAALREHQARVAAGSARAEQPLLNWLTREPKDIAIRRRLADHYQRTGLETAAIDQLEQIVRMAPNDVASLNNLAWLLARSDVARAEQLARRANAIVPQEPSVADTLGWVLIGAGKHVEAVKILEQAARGLPKDRAVRYHYALALARTGDKVGARRELENALAGEVSFVGWEAARQLKQELTT